MRWSKAWLVLPVLSLLACEPSTGVDLDAGETGSNDAATGDSGACEPMACDYRCLQEGAPAGVCRPSGCVCLNVDAGGGSDSAAMDAVPTRDGDAPADVGTGPDVMTARDGGGGSDASFEAGSDAGSDAGPTGPVLRDGTLTFVMSEYQIDTSDDPTVPVAGFNLDDLWSDGSLPNDCSKQDSPSSVDLDQNCLGVTGNTCPAGAANTGCAYAGESGACRGGVDNQYPVVANTVDTVGSTGPGGLRGLIATSIRQHRWVTLVRVTGIDGALGGSLNDDRVTVSVYTGYPTFNTGCTAVAPDREYRVARSSLRPGATSIDAAQVQFTGRIRNGRVEVQTTDPWPLPFNGFFFATSPDSLTPVRQARLRFTLDARGEASRGNFGGYVTGADLVDTINRDPMAAMFRMQLIGILGGLVDVQLDGICATGGSTPRFGALGIGAAPSFVPARIAASPIADAPMSGACGTGS